MLDTVTAHLAEDAKSIRNLFIVHGCTAKGAQKKVVELYSPPRVTREFAAALGAYPGLRAGPTLGLMADEHGQQYDCTTAADRQRCRARLRAERLGLL